MQTPALLDSTIIIYCDNGYEVTARTFTDPSDQSTLVSNAIREYSNQPLIIHKTDRLYYSVSSRRADGKAISLNESSHIHVRKIYTAQEIDELFKLQQNYNLTEYDGYVDKSGNIINDTTNGEKYSERLYINDGSVISININYTTNRNGWCSIAIYDENNNLLIREVPVDHIDTSLISIVYTVDNNSASYIIISYRSFNETKASVNIYNNSIQNIIDFKLNIYKTKKDIYMRK